MGMPSQVSFRFAESNSSVSLPTDFSVGATPVLIATNQGFGEKLVRVSALDSGAVRLAFESVSAAAPSASSLAAYNFIPSGAVDVAIPAGKSLYAVGVSSQTISVSSIGPKVPPAATMEVLLEDDSLYAAWLPGTALKERTSPSTATQALAAADPVGWIPDVGPNGFDLIAASGTLAAISSTKIGGLNAITCAATKYLQTASSTFWNGLRTTGFSVYAVIQPPSSTTGYRFVFGDSAAGQLFLGYDNGTMNFFVFAQNTNVLSGSYAVPAAYTEPIVVAMTWIQGTARFYVNGQLVAEKTGIGASNLPAGAFVYGNAGSFFDKGLTSPMGPVLVYAATHSQDQVMNTVGALLQRASPSAPTLVIDSNSLGLGWYGGGSAVAHKPSDLGVLIEGLLGDNWNVVQLSVGGETTNTKVLRTFAQKVEGVYSPCKSKLPRLAFLWECTNDMAAIGGDGRTVEAAWQNFLALVASYRSMGYTKLLVGTVLQRSVANGGSDFEAKRTDFNNRLRAWAPANNGIVVDFDLDEVINAAGAVADTNVFPDGIHLKGDKYPRIAKRIVAAIRGFVQSYSL